MSGNLFIVSAPSGAGKTSLVKGLLACNGQIDVFPDCISIFILPPSLQALETRLKGRGQDSADVIAQRMHAAQEDIAHVAEFDYVIINDKLDEALQQLNAIVIAAGLRRDRQLARQQKLIQQLQNQRH